MARPTLDLTPRHDAATPSNVMLAEEFAQRFDGFSIGDSPPDLIQVAYVASHKVDICGQAPGDYPELAASLVEAGIDSISLTAAV